MALDGEKIERLKSVLDKKLGPEYISYRQGPAGGGRLTYIEGWKAINLANEILGFNGWSSSITSLTIDFADYSEQSGRWNVGVTAIVRVTLADGTFHEDIGYGHLENSKSKAAAFDKCKKEAVTDGLKRALRHFGNALGNCLYSKSYTADVSKIRVQQTLQQPFNADTLYTGPEIEERSSEIKSRAVKPEKTSPSVNVANARSQVPKAQKIQDASEVHGPKAKIPHVEPRGPYTNMPTSEYDNDVDDGMLAELMNDDDEARLPSRSRVAIPENDVPGCADLARDKVYVQQMLANGSKHLNPYRKRGFND